VAVINQLIRVAVSLMLIKAVTMSNQELMIKTKIKVEIQIKIQTTLRIRIKNNQPTVIKMVVSKINRMEPKKKVKTLKKMVIQISSKLIKTKIKVISSRIKMANNKKVNKIKIMAKKDNKTSSNRNKARMVNKMIKVMESKTKVVKKMDNNKIKIPKFLQLSNQKKIK
jgi:hypothetical protein